MKKNNSPVRMCSAMIENEQQRLIQAIEAVHTAYQLMSNEDVNINVVFHQHACNNSPGWNVFLKNIRFELGYQFNKLRFSLPPEENKFDEFIIFLTEDLGFQNYSSNYRTGIKYVFELELDEFIYTDEGIGKISRLTNEILRFA